MANRQPVMMLGLGPDLFRGYLASIGRHENTTIQQLPKNQLEEYREYRLRQNVFHADPVLDAELRRRINQH